MDEFNQLFDDHLFDIDEVKDKDRMKRLIKDLYMESISL